MSDSGPEWGLPRWAGVVVVLAYLAHVWTKIQLHLLVELLAACHVATLLVAAGVLLRSRWIAGAGLLFTLVLGLPFWLLDAVVRHQTTWTSAVVHLTAPAIALMALRPVAWPRASLLLAWGLMPALAVLCRFTTPPDLNVNLAFHAWADMGNFFPSFGVYWLCNFVGMGVILITADLALRRWWVSLPR